MEKIEFEPGVSFGPITIGMTHDDVMANFGMPESVYPSSKDIDVDCDCDNCSCFNDRKYWCYPNKGLDVEFGSDGRVRAIFTYVSMGVKTGYSFIVIPFQYKAEVREELGPPDISADTLNIDDDMDWDYYDDGVQFNYVKGKVAHMVIFNPDDELSFD